MMDHPDGQGTALEVPRPQTRVWLCRAPLLAAALIIVLINSFNLKHRLTEASPRDPWEAAEVVEGWRSLHGMPVYDASPDAHATHMYGPLAPWSEGVLFRLAGANNVVGRYLTLVCSLLTVSVLAVVVRSPGSGWLLAVGWAIILGANYRGGDYFVANRPDMIAFFFATLAVLMMGLGHERRRWWLVGLGSGFLVLGFFYKQPAAIFAAVPAVALCLRWRIPTRAEVVFALVPLGVIGAVIVGLRLFNPTVYYYMVQCPRGFKVGWPMVGRITWEVLIESPLFVVLVGEWIANDERPLREQPRLLWALATIAVTLPASAMFRSKVGGSVNSLLPALLAMAAFCALRLPRLAHVLERPSTRFPARGLLGIFLAALLLMTAFPRVSGDYQLLVARPTHQDAYRNAVAIAAKLPGKVTSSKDPTMALYSKGYVGRNLFLELDSRPTNGDWPHSPPECILDEIRASDYVLDVPAWGDNMKLDSRLSDLGFVEVPTPAINPHYRLWRRD